jgi:homoserine O-succinyltransferase/O-acetyltransferase
MALEVEPRPIGPGADAPRPGARSDALVVGLINNMPDSALEGTEAQFSGLLTAASRHVPVRLRYASLPEVPRGSDVRARIAERYWTLEELFGGALDALIVTGTEPRAASLADEPYWDRLVEVIAFADAHTISSAWSCLAAHAAVLHLDGIQRRRLPMKRFGVFEQDVLVGHPLTQALGSTLRTPHSRWNDLPLEALASAGYTILSSSREAGADAFVKTRRSLMVFFQGHPEYEDRTLLKEYQRDVGRFVSGEYKQYPTVPAGYFGPAALSLLDDFERRLKAGEVSHPLTAFPFRAVAASLMNTWRSQAAQIYENWLVYVAAKKFGGSGRPRHAL